MSTINMTNEQMAAELARLQAENERLQKANGRKTDGGLLVSEKRACSLYGVGRFPVTLHRGQWIKMFEILDVPVPPKLASFLERNKGIFDAVEAERAANKASKGAVTVK